MDPSGALVLCLILFVLFALAVGLDKKSAKARKACRQHTSPEAPKSDRSIEALPANPEAVYGKPVLIPAITAAQLLKDFEKLATRAVKIANFYDLTDLTVDDVMRLDGPTVDAEVARLIDEIEKRYAGEILGVETEGYDAPDAPPDPSGDRFRELGQLIADKIASGEIRPVAVTRPRIHTCAVGGGVIEHDLSLRRPEDDDG